MKMEKAEKELKKCVEELRVDRLCGSINTCAFCGKRGHFGSIKRISMDNDEYIVCGWCGSIIKSTFVKKGDIKEK